MPKRIAPLTDTKVRTIKSAEKPLILFDGGGLFLLVTPTGGKLWNFKYRFAGKEKKLSLGLYPDVPLAEARHRRDQARTLLANGVPSDTKKAQKAAGTEKKETFEAIAREWHAKFTPTWATRHGDKIIRRLELYVFPWLGNRPIKSITPPELLSVLRRIEAKGTLETAHRTQQNCSQVVFRYAVAIGRAERDPSGGLRGAIPPAAAKHMATITDPKGIAGLLRSIDDYMGGIVTRCALQLAPLAFVRPGELRHAEWAEINFDAAEWRIPAEKMKAGAGCPE